MFWNTHAIKDIAGSGSNIFDKSVSGWSQCSGSFLGYDFLHHVEAEVSVDAVGCEETEHLRHDVLVGSVVDFGRQDGYAVFEGLSFTIGLGKVLHGVGSFSHEDVVAGDSSFTKVFGIVDKLFEVDCFSVLKKIEESSKI